MPKEKIQAYVEPDILARFNKIARVNGWAPGELISRLLLFYVRAHGLAEAFTIQQDPEGDLIECYRQDPETGEYDYWDSIEEPFLSLIETLQEGLLPDDCFGRLNIEGDEDHE